MVLVKKRLSRESSSLRTSRGALSAEGGEIGASNNNTTALQSVFGMLSCICTQHQPSMHCLAAFGLSSCSLNFANGGSLPDRGGAGYVPAHEAHVVRDGHGAEGCGRGKHPVEGEQGQGGQGKGGKARTSPLGTADLTQPSEPSEPLAYGSFSSCGSAAGSSGSVRWTGRPRPPSRRTGRPSRNRAPGNNRAKAGSPIRGSAGAGAPTAGTASSRGGANSHTRIMQWRRI